MSKNLFSEFTKKGFVKIKLDKKTVKEKLSNISEDEDLRRYIL